MWSASDARGKYEYADLNHDTEADQKTHQDRCEHGGSKVRLVIRQQSVSWSQFVGQVGSEVKVYSCC
jgi:hypothetical protein